MKTHRLVIVAFVLVCLMLTALAGLPVQLPSFFPPVLNDVRAAVL